MIKGIGIDVIELERIKKNVSNKAFLKRILTTNEMKQFEILKLEKRRVEFVAGRFAAKEAFAKATGTGIGSLSFQDIEIVNNEQGAPLITVDKYNDYTLHVSISHSNTVAVAQVIIEECKR